MFLCLSINSITRTEEAGKKIALQNQKTIEYQKKW